MEFSKYIWDLYKESETGKYEIGLFSSKNYKLLAEKFNFTIEIENEDDPSDTFFLYEEIKNEFLNELNGKQITRFSEARELIKNVLINIAQEENFNKFLEYLGVASTVLYHIFPDYFLPFYFTSEDYTKFLALCDDFEIALPNNPQRNDWVKRTLFYFEICECLHEFRSKIGIDSLEFPAFMYFFGLRTLKKQEEQDLPKPSKVRFIGGGKGDYEFLDNVDKESTNTWGAGNLQIKKGDILLMYCTAPRSSLQSIWRATEDSFVFPFGYYYYQVQIGYPKKIPLISLNELKNNQVFKNNSSVRGNMQGLNGRGISVEEYIELLKLIEEKGKNTKLLPKLPEYIRDNNNIENEHDVEIILIEPLLRDLGFAEKNWVRQFPLRMGRKTKYYPDYAILAKTTKGIERAKYILEAKYSISSDKQLIDAFHQARSYALRLQSDKIILADIEFVWLFERNNSGFQQAPILKLNWMELKDPDKLYLLKQRLVE